jgi:RimJ/RimL family protein N-acetyltransferase
MHLPFETDRLLIEPLRADHAAGLFGPLSDPRVYESIGGAPPASVAVLADRFARMISGPPPHRTDEQWLNYAVRLRVDDTLIGTLQADISHERAEVAYLFGPAYWGRGYAKEAMAAFHEELGRNWGVREFWATTSPGNSRSIRLLGSLGYTERFDSWPALASYDPGDRVFAHRRQE